MILSKRSVLRNLENPNARYFSFINDTLALATIVSILAIILETVPSFSRYHDFFLLIEWAAVCLFSMEYILRVWATPRKLAYILSPFGIIDLISILPTFIGIGNLTFLKSARVIRIMRFLRLLRLAKLSHLKTENAEETLGIFAFNIVLYACALIFVMLILGVTLHLFIQADGQYWSIPQGMYWSFAVFLGGLPAPIPPGTAGTVIFIITKFAGMALFGLLVGIVGKVFNEWILGKK